MREVKNLKKASSVWIVFFVFSLFYTNYFAITVKVGIYDNPPISFYTDGKAQGIFPKVMNYIAKEEGWKLNYVYAPFYTLLDELKKGKIDVLLAVVQTSERSKKYDFTNEYLFSNWAQVYTYPKSSILSPFDLKNKRVGVLKSDIFYNSPVGIKYLLDHLNVHVQYVEFNTYPDIFKALQKRKIDAGVTNWLFGNSNKFKYNVVETPIVFSPVEEKIAFSKDDPIAKAIRPIIDGYIKRLKENPNSVLNTSLNEYLKKNPSRFTFPKWLVYLGVFVSIGFLALVINVIILKKLLKIKTVQLEKNNSELMEKNEELLASNEEIRAMNEELNEAYENLQKLNNRFQTISVLLSQFDMTNVKTEDFLNQVLSKSLDLITAAKYGSVWIKENGEWRIVAVRGHDEKALKAPEAKWKIRLIEKPRIIKDILKEDEKTLSEDMIKSLKKATKPIKETLVVPLKFSDELFGNVALDIPQGSDEKFTGEDVEVLSNFAKIASAFYVARRYLQAQRELTDKMMFLLVKTLEKYDVYTKGHSERVGSYSKELAKFVGLDEETQKRIYRAGLLHDIGKIFVPLDILTKNGKLTVEEYEEIKKHPVIGAELIEEGTGLTYIARIVRHHHERWDGRGYPDGLKGEEIPLESRIMSVCDAYDAMTSDRAYRKALEAEGALERLKQEAGKQFDPKLVKAFLEMIKAESSLSEGIQKC